MFNTHRTAFAKPDSLLESWKESVRPSWTFSFSSPAFSTTVFFSISSPDLESQGMCWCISVLSLAPQWRCVKGRSVAGYDFWVALTKRDRKWRNKKKGSKGSGKQNCLCFVSFRKELLQALSSPVSFGGSGKSPILLEKITGKTILPILQTIAV